MKMSEKNVKTSCQELIEQEIKRFGPMNFGVFMNLALYHPTHGYYNQKSPRRGRMGDYFTSYQVSDLFPRIFTDVFIAMKKELDADQFTLIEMGAGDGEFIERVLKDFHKRGEYKSLRVYVVEKSKPAREKLWTKLSRFSKCQVIPTLDDIDIVGGVEGCIFSNELFDSFPFRRFIKNEEVESEILIDIKDETLQEVIPEFSSEAHQIEKRIGVDEFFSDAEQILTRGYITTVDYGYPRAELQLPERKNGTWLCYHKHKTSQNALEKIGQQDITAHVDFTELASCGRPHEFKPLLFCKQGIFLSYAGEKIISDFLETANELERVKRARAVQQLLHPEAMGGLFKILIQGRGSSLPENLKKIPNRLQRIDH